MEPITPEMLYDAIREPGWTQARAIDVLRINPRTWNRWMRGLSPIPFPEYELLRLLAGGFVPAGGVAWEGWRFANGKLWSPHGWDFDPIDLTHLAWIRLNSPELFYARATPPRPVAAPANVLPFPDPRLIVKG